MHEALRKLLDENQIKAYLARIGLDAQIKEATPDYLDEIIKAQLRTIPFDDADVWANRAFPSLATDDLFDKIIARKRGGYCFELNGLFKTFLVSLGFDAYEVIIHLGRPELMWSEVNFPSHCGVVVNFGGRKRFADVGFGGPVPDGSVPMDGTEVNGHRMFINGPYTVVASKAQDGWFPRFTFKDAPCDPAEIVPLNFHVSQKPDSVFAADLKMNIRMDDGFGEFGNKHFKYKKGNLIIEKDVETEEEAKEIALKYFGIPNLPTRAFDK